MKPIGFAICNTINYSPEFTLGKIYPYYERMGLDEYGDFKIKLINGLGNYEWLWMCLELKPHNDNCFDFHHYPEFPEDISTWTEDDWFQYDLKYGS